ncbi:Nif3-like dinuclear metal center hexameric protein [Gemella haemolysans]|uniref:Nif3-like dinuclear metal center hexameric protein n=1 Tax=Gemella haemolysans TaxID=1379 RepID=UPI0019586B45|nr:Nif3-like dinuclear metal center hexameric protein [Gemella haemolysans]VTX84271.1 GTP cyclohydrolase 1 type 2 [Gemella haemolysans]
MTTVKDVFNHLNNLADVKLAEKWDNVGLMLGSNNNEVSRVLVCLDVTTSVVEEAIANNVNLIVSHHPLIFKPLKNIDYTTDFKSRIIRNLIKNDISVISFHTNLDSATLGLNDYLAKILKLNEIQVLFEHSLDNTAGLGRIGKLSKPLKLSDFIIYVKNCFSLETVSAVIGDEKEISTIALLGGSGADFIYTLPEVDVYLTGDVGYHAALDAIEMKKNIIDVGHFSENLVKDLLLDYISELNVEVIKSTVEKSPFKIL